MKQLLVSFILSFFFASAQAQVEFVEHFSASNNLEAAIYVADASGNIYLLAQHSPYNPKNIMPSNDGFNYVLYKIGSDGKIAWKKSYTFFVLAKHIFLLQNKLFISYTKTFGYIDCGGGTREYSSKNGGIMIDIESGKLIKDVLFKENKNCGLSRLMNTSVRKDKSIAYIYNNDLSQKNYLHVRNETLGFAWEKEFNKTDGYAMYNITYDNLMDQYIVGDSIGLNIYNAKWEKVRNIPMPYVGSMPWGANYRVVYNKDYYLIHFYGNTNTKDVVAYTAVYSRAGKQLALSSTTQYADVFLTADNQVVAISSIDPWHLSPQVKTPLSITIFDIALKVKKTKDIGKPFVKAIGLYVKNGEVTVIGNAMTSIPKNPAQSPNGLYFYRAKML